jgi:phospholipid/cholesterol/gamma-HCH transport system substrate-binding protein
MARQVTRTQARSFLVGLGAIAVLAGVIYLSLTANTGRLPGTPVTTVTAAFANVGQLQTGSDVRQNGIRVGQVSNVAFQRDQAIVTMTLNGDVPVYSDAYAGIWDQSALAQKFVELNAGNPATGRLGDRTIPLAQTESTHDLVDLLDVFQPDTRAALSSSLRALGGGVAGYGPGLHGFIAGAPQMLNSLGTVSTALSSDQADLPALLRSTDALTSRFEGREAQITSLLAQTDQTMQALGVDGGVPLSDTLKGLPPALTSARDAFNKIYGAVDDTGTAMTDLQSGAVALGQATPDVRGVLTDGVRPLDSVPDVSDSAKPAVDELTAVFSDARPFVPRVANGLSSAAEPLAVLAPYAQDIGTFSFDIGNLIGNHDGWLHRLRIMVGSPGLDSPLTGELVKDTNNPYPAPGQAIRDRDTNGGLIPGTGR